jgi:hypothetical protein
LEFYIWLSGNDELQALMAMIQKFGVPPSVQRLSMIVHYYPSQYSLDSLRAEFQSADVDRTLASKFVGGTKRSTSRTIDLALVVDSGFTNKLEKKLMGSVARMFPLLSERGLLEASVTMGP